MLAESPAPAKEPATDPPAADNAKCRQIVDGARRVFLAHGFEGASMNDIAKEAGVSKGTLYVYFENKERLFAAIVDEERSSHVERIFEFDYNSPDVEGTLLELSAAITAFICQPRIISAMRAVMGITERMPDIGAHFYNAGPGHSRKQLAKYLDLRVAAGQLDIDDTELAAAQFLEMSHGPLLKPMFFMANNTPPTKARIREVAQSAVRVFMAAYGVKK
ncbi:TetR/AcrR family transcriptional regulator [Labrys portucalensis]|uniref:TetR/AcrR family transcriptional regulator n=1 Tax=Labrys neptuniae TaxID=376174 RepID=A0ABV3PTZ7_9HYPH|nr:TetR/AcrR family transcriptional regulator [Labrys neptuniae]MDT3378009.1 TetR/AcrR family transcriptional regulator [Labrys neptuniae]